MNAETLNSIREAEKASHIEIYSAAKLFEKGTWLQKPVKPSWICFRFSVNIKC